MLRQGQQPLQVYAAVHSQQPLIRSLGQVLQNGHTVFGSFRLYSAGRHVSQELVLHPEHESELQTCVHTLSCQFAHGRNLSMCEGPNGYAWMTYTGFPHICKKAKSAIFVQEPG